MKFESIFSFAPNASIQYEEDCFIHHSARVIGNLQIGAYTYIGYNCLIGSSKIGRFCSIAPNVTIGLGEHPIDKFSTHPIFYGSSLGFNVPKGIGSSRKILPIPEIEDDVWIGTNSVIRRGVKIGKGAIVGAGAVVTRDIPPYQVWGGVPAKFIKSRFSDDLVEQLIGLDWTTLKLEIFCGVDPNDINRFIEIVKKGLQSVDNLVSYKKSTAKKVNNKIILNQLKR